MHSCGSYRDELLSVAVNTLLRAERWTGITGRTLDVISTVASAGAILHASTRKEGKFRDPLEMEIKRRPGGVGSTEQERERKDREMGARC